MAIFVGMLFAVTCLLLIIVVLLQKGRGGGLGAAFGGAGSSAFGARTGDVFTWVTIVLTALFLVLAIVAVMAYREKPGTVMGPVFWPAPGPITENKDVTLSCPTKGAVIHYTLDGSDPTERSPAYEEAFTVIPGTTVKARAYRTGWKDPSVIVVAEYYNPFEPPSATAPATAPVTAPATAPRDEE